MKHFLKMFLIMIMAFFLLVAGVYFSLANVSKLLAAGKPNMQCQWLASELQIKTGKWCETVNLPAPFEVRRQTHIWTIHSCDFTLTVTTKPKLRILWKKTSVGREAIPNGEY
jgi:hypothetical protein